MSWRETLIGDLGIVIDDIEIGAVLGNRALILGAAKNVAKRNEDILKFLISPEALSISEREAIADTYAQNFAEDEIVLNYIAVNPIIRSYIFNRATPLNVICSSAQARNYMGGPGDVIYEYGVKPYDLARLKYTAGLAKINVANVTQWGDMSHDINAIHGILNSETACILWKDSETPLYLYDEGVEPVTWVEGASKGTDEYLVEKQADRLYLFCREEDDNAHRTWVTDIPFNLTYVNTLAVDWTGAGSNENGNRRRFVADPNKMNALDGGYTFLRTYRWDRAINNLDVSGASGNFYIMVSTQDGRVVGTGYNSTLYIYKVMIIN